MCRTSALRTRRFVIKGRIRTCWVSRRAFGAWEGRLRRQRDLRCVFCVVLVALRLCLECRCAVCVFLDRIRTCRVRRRAHFAKEGRINPSLGIRRVWRVMWDRTCRIWGRQIRHCAHRVRINLQEGSHTVRLVRRDQYRAVVGPRCAHCATWGPTLLGSWANLRVRSALPGILRM